VKLHYRPSIEGMAPNVACDEAVITLYYTPFFSFAIRLCAIPRKQILVLVQRTAKGTPIVPILAERIDLIRIVMVTIDSKSEQVLFRQAVGCLAF
jgi:hypothetical protein